MSKENPFMGGNDKEENNVPFNNFPEGEKNEGADHLKEERTSDAFRRMKELAEKLGIKNPKTKIVEERKPYPPLPINEFGKRIMNPGIKEYETKNRSEK